MVVSVSLGDEIVLFNAQQFVIGLFVTAVLVAPKIAQHERFSLAAVVQESDRQTRNRDRAGATPRRKQLHEVPSTRSASRDTHVGDHTGIARLDQRWLIHNLRSWTACPSVTI
jgi:hypothetical protein